MANLTRFNPWNELRTMRQMMDRAFSDWPTMRSDYETMMEPMIDNLRLDAWYEDGNLVVKAEVPGYKPEDINVTIDKDILTVKADTTEEKEVKDKDYVMREYRSSNLSRSVRLPADVDADKANAYFDNGVLYLRFPYTGATRQRRIEVQTGTHTAEAPRVRTGETTQQPAHAK